MRFVALLAGMVWMTGCATGATGVPLGGRLTFENLRYQPATPAAMPRPIPDEVEDSTPKRHVQPVAHAVVSRDARKRVLTTARALVGQSQMKVAGRTYPSDCTGLVEAAYTQAGLSLKGAAKPGDNGVTALYRYALNHGRVYNGGRPMPGDLVFFRETYDQNRDGRRNDGLTHVGLVDDVDKDGTVTVIHHVKRGVVRYRMNLSKPGVGKDPDSGKVLNDTLRAPGQGHSFALTGQLFVAYATVLPGSKPVAVAQR
ncbi:MAG: CHAP domain-containing protein [Hyalangium sp.]|uniref:CHAP domain-containing protein n=1 Tax=Hyalangium sp. TaxID=2028555 RepID=UPI00389A247F